jgi:L-fuculose-phosphate aldolase
MSSGDIVICDKDGKKISGTYQPSSEYKMHVLIYKYRYDVKAVCHGHPVCATAYACAGKPLNKAILPEILISLGAVPLVEYATPGSDKLSQNLGSYLGRYDAFLLQSHGVVTLGKSIEEAFNRLEKVERYASILLNAEQIGGAKLLSRSETELLLNLSGRVSILDDIEYS